MAANESSTHSPWTARPTRNALGGGPVVNHAGEMSYDILDTTGRVVAVVWAEEGVPVDLIAAAPEVLDELRGLIAKIASGDRVHTLRAGDGYTTTIVDAETEKARALLARLG